MKHCQQVVLGALFLFLLPFTAFAGAGYLAIEADEEGINCNLANPAPFALVTVYVFHKFGVPGESASASRFRLETPSGWSLLGFTATAGYTPVGDVHTDLTVAFPCTNTPVRIGSALYIGQPTPPCTQLRIEAPQASSAVTVYDCSFVDYNTVAEGALINPQGSCCCQCLATESSTWGQVKGLYR